MPFADNDRPKSHPFPSSAAESDALRAAQDQFILEWGRMSSSWGINRTMAQIHALLFVVEEPVDVNDIDRTPGGVADPP